MQSPEAQVAGRSANRDDERWRAAVLRAAGASRREARAIAQQRSIDVHKLVSRLEQGYSVSASLALSRNEVSST